MGVAFLCKFTGVLAIPVAALYLATSAETRGWFRRPSLYLGGLVALLIAAPVLGWNHLHGWPSLQLHLVERMPAATDGAYARHAAQLAVGQLVLFHPLILPGLLAAAVSPRAAPSATDATACSRSRASRCWGSSSR